MRTAQQVDHQAPSDPILQICAVSRSSETAIDRLAESIAKRLVRIIGEWSFEASEGPPFGVGLPVDDGTEVAGA